MEKLIIAIDGPSASGKTTIAVKLSESLGIIYINTGAMYRALAYECLNKGLNPKNETDANFVANNTNLKIEYINGVQNVYVNNKNVTDLLFSDEIALSASQIAKHSVVRKKLVSIQRSIAQKQSVIVDGRDIGSVVLPNANFKFYIDASVEERAKRRYNDYYQKSIPCTYEEILNDIKQRDINDLTREESPLIKCDDAFIIDSTNLSISDVVSKILTIIKKEGK